MDRSFQINFIAGLLTFFRLWGLFSSTFMDLNTQVNKIKVTLALNRNILFFPLVINLMFLVVELLLVFFILELSVLIKYLKILLCSRPVKSYSMNNKKCRNSN